MASREASKTVKVSDQMPNKRERAASQYGQINDLESTHWNGDPASLKEAINRMAAEIYALKTNTPID